MRASRRFALYTGGTKGFEIPSYTGNHTIVGDVTQGYMMLTTSGILTFAGDGVCDICLVGGGQGGRKPSHTGTTRTGGNGGKVVNVFGQYIPAGNHSVVIGAGGAAADNTKNSGGDTTLGEWTGSGATSSVYQGAGGPEPSGAAHTYGGKGAYAFGDSVFSAIRYGAGGGGADFYPAYGSSYSGNFGVTAREKGCGGKTGSVSIDSYGTPSYSTLGRTDGYNGLVIIRWGY